MQSYPKVGLFGSIQGGWREDHVIPLLKELGVSYFHPGASSEGWTQVMGLREADVLENCETIVMVINDSTPGFGGLAEAGWSALGANTRGQNFILYVQTEYHFDAPFPLQWIPAGKKLAHSMEDYAKRTRFLVSQHAKRFKHIPGLFVVDDIEGVVKSLKDLYAK